MVGMFHGWREGEGAIREGFLELAHLKVLKKQFEHFNILKSKLFSFSKLQEQVTIKLYTADIEVYYINVKQMLYFKISPPIKTILS